jgi:hypothetical protein
VLERFIVDGENISVRIEGQGVLPITDYRRPGAPPAPPGRPAAAQPRREGAPGGSTSIYNRALYQPDQAPTRGAPPPQPAAPQPGPAQPQPGQPQQQPGQAAKKDEQQQKDRFTLIELE